MCQIFTQLFHLKKSLKSCLVERAREQCKWPGPRARQSNTCWVWVCYHRRCVCGWKRSPFCDLAKFNGVWRPYTIKLSWVTKHFTVRTPCLVLFDRVWSCLVFFGKIWRPSNNRSEAQNISFFRLFDGRCFVRLDSRVSNMFGAGMRTTLGQRLVSIVSSVFDQTCICFNRLATHFDISLFGHQTMFDGVWLPNIYRLSRP